MSKSRISPFWKQVSFKLRISIFFVSFYRINIIFIPWMQVFIQGLSYFGVAIVNIICWEQNTLKKTNLLIVFKFAFILT